MYHGEFSGELQKRKRFEDSCPTSTSGTNTCKTSEVDAERCHQDKAGFTRKTMQVSEILYCITHLCMLF